MDWNIKKPLVMARMIDFFVDTNILIYILERYPHPAVSYISQFSLGISVITEIELLGKKNITEQETNIIQSLLKDCEIIDFNNSVKEIAISIKQNCSVELADSIIAATAKSFNLPLVTADKDFKKIKDADIVILDLNK